MAAKRKSSLPPPRSPSSSSDDSSDDSSSGEELDHATPTPSVAKNLNRTEQANNKSDSDSDSDSGSDSDSDPEPPKAPLKPSNSDSSSSDESEEESKPKSHVAKSESKPDKKKEKVSGPDQSPSVKSSSSAFLRIWSEEDEMAVLKALSEYHARKGLLPQVKEYAGFLSTVSSSIGFPVTEKQLANKIQQFKRAYDKKINKGTDVSLSKPHDKAVFELCAKLFGGRSSKTAPEKKVKLEPKNVVKMENGGSSNGHAMGPATNGGVAHGDATARSYYYLRWFIEELIKERPGGFSTVEDFIAQIGEPKAKALEAKIKTLRIDMFKLLARKEALRAELFDVIAEEMADD